MIERFQYDNRIVKNFLFITILWGWWACWSGLFAALQLVVPGLNFAEWVSFGRFRPLHTNAVIFAFVGNAIFAGAYYSLQRLLKTRMFSDLLSKIHFWGWQLIIVAAAITLPLGMTRARSTPNWSGPSTSPSPSSGWSFGINMMGTIIKRRERHLYVAIWFYIATWVTVAMLHIVNSIACRSRLTKSYSWYAGVQDALVQWWYGHNAVAFFLTTPFLGLMYYFLPKAAEPSGVQLQALHHPLLVAHLPLHLGRSAPLALQRPAGMGAILGGGVQHHAHRAQLGRHAEWPAHLARCVGPCA
jgi:cytochrome c oxidase cbb3-type subunit I/II